MKFDKKGISRIELFIVLIAILFASVLGIYILNCPIEKANEYKDNQKELRN